jgi:hypothetical protein
MEGTLTFMPSRSISEKAEKKVHLPIDEGALKPIVLLAYRGISIKIYEKIVFRF